MLALWGHMHSEVLSIAVVGVATASGIQNRARNKRPEAYNNERLRQSCCFGLH